MLVLVFASSGVCWEGIKALFVGCIFASDWFSVWVVSPVAFGAEKGGFGTFFCPQVVVVKVFGSYIRCGGFWRWFVACFAPDVLTVR